MRIHVARGDITEIRVDCIVNAANSGLLGGGGVDGAIHRAGGPSILEECRRLRESRGGCETGKAVITGAGWLPARYVIHTVGPVWRGGEVGEARLLASCYRESVKLAEEVGCKSIAFPAISTGIYGFPKKEAARVVFEFARSCFSSGNDSDTEKELYFINFDEENFLLYRDLFVDLISDGPIPWVKTST